MMFVIYYSIIDFPTQAFQCIILLVYVFILIFHLLLCVLLVTLSVPQDLMRLKLDLQEMVIVKEEQEDLLRRRERELTALKGALKEEVSTHDQEVDKLREQYEKEIRKLQGSLEVVKQVMNSHHPFQIVFF